jgi:hypothetical protein
LTINDILSDGHHLENQTYESFNLIFRNKTFTLQSLDYNLTNSTNDIINTYSKNNQQSSIIPNRFNIELDLNNVISKINSEFYNMESSYAKGGLITFEKEYIDQENFTNKKYNYDSNNTGPFEFTINYQEYVDQVYHSRMNNLNYDIDDYSRIDIGDKINSNITIQGTNYLYPFMEGTENKINDDSGTNSDIGSININKSIYHIKRNNESIDIHNNTKLNPNDLVTYRIEMNLSHQNFQDFTIDTFMAIPTINVGDLKTDFIKPSNDIPDENIIKYGPTHTLYYPDNTSSILNPSLDYQDKGTNCFRLNYDTYQIQYYKDINEHDIENKKIDILYTVRINDEPTEDQLLMTNQSIYNIRSTILTEKESHDFVGIILNQPEIVIQNSINSFEDNSHQTYDKAKIVDSSHIILTHDNIGITNTMTLEDSNQSNVENIDRNMEVKFVFTIKNIGSTDAYNVKVIDDKGGNINIMNIDTLEILDGNGTSQITNISNHDNLFTTGLVIPKIEISNPIRLVIIKGRVGTIDREIDTETITNTTSILSYTNQLDSDNSFPVKDIYDTSYSKFRGVKLNKYITYNTEDAERFTQRTNETVTIGEIVRVQSTMIIPTGQITNLGLRDEIDFRDDVINNSGLELIGTRLESESEYYKLDESNVLTNKIIHNQYEYYTFGDYNNPIQTEQKLHVIQIIRITNNKFNEKFIYGKYTNSSQIESQYNAHLNKSQLKIVAYNNFIERSNANNSNTLKSSNNVKININEPFFKITKSILNHGNHRLSKGDTFTYKILVDNSNLTNYSGYNMNVNDKIPDNLEVKEFFLLNDNLTKNKDLDFTDNNLVYNIGELKSSQQVILNVVCVIKSYHATDEIINTAYLTYENLDSSLNIKEYYSSPTDNEKDKLIFEEFYQNEAKNSNVHRNYSLNDTVSFRTDPIIKHNLTNFTNNNMSLSHPKNDEHTNATIGDKLKSSCEIVLPKGTSYINDVKLYMPNTFTNVRLSNDAIVLRLDDEIISQEEIKPITGRKESNYVEFNFNHHLTNNSSNEKSLIFDYYFDIKNNHTNVIDKIGKIDYNLLTRNSVNQLNTIQTLNGELTHKIVEPSMNITQELISIPLQKNDTFDVKVILTIGNKENNTNIFNPEFELYTTNKISNVSSVMPDKNWNVDTTKDGVIRCYYDNIDEDDLDKEKGLDTNTKPYEFIFTLQLNEDDPLEFDEKYVSRVRNSWSSQPMLTTNTSEYIVKMNDGKSDEEQFITRHDVELSFDKLNNYFNDDNKTIYMREAYEKFRFGLSIEDALDFDYDYEDVVCNVMYRIYRNKFGIKRMVADFHVVARGAAYDHTFGISIPGLKNHEGKYNVYCYEGHNNQTTDMKDLINDYLKNSDNSELTIDNLRGDDIPLIISTQDVLPPDHAKQFYEFSTNTANRSEEIKEWVKPCTVRLVLDLETEIKGNLRYFIPYIDVRGPGNNKVDPKYDDYEYRHDLSSHVDISKKEFDYTGFPKMLITPIDMNHGEDYGEIDEYYAFKDIYTGLVDYLTDSKYPNIDSMKDMTDIRKRVEEVNKPDSIYNNEKLIKKDNLMYREHDEYVDKLNLDDIQDKDNLNEYHGLNVFRLDSVVHNVGKYMFVNYENETKIFDGEYVDSGNYEDKMIGIKLSDNGTKLVDVFENLEQYEKISESTDIIRIKISDGDYLVGITNKHYPVLLGKDRKEFTQDRVCDVVLFKEKYVVGINHELKLINFMDEGKFSQIEKIMKIESNDKNIFVLTCDNKLFMLDDNESKEQLFDDKTVIEFVVDNNFVFVLDSEQRVHMYDITEKYIKNDFTINTRKISFINNGIYSYYVGIRNTGVVELLPITTETPKIGTYGIYKMDDDKVALDVSVTNAGIMIKYI